MAKIATLQTSSVSATPNFVPLGYEEERVVLGLMMQGKTNLQIVNHYSTLDLRLTLEQVQRVRDLADIAHPASPSKVGHPSGRRPSNRASGSFEMEGAEAAATATTKNADPSCTNTVSLAHPAIELPPEFKREKSEVASGAARAVSSMLVRGLRGRGWQGTLAALGIYLVSIYIVFLAVAHFAAWLMHWMFEHRVLTLMAAGIFAWAYSSFVGRGPVRVRLSRAANDAVRGYAMRASLAALVMIRHAVAAATGTRDAREATSEAVGGHDSAEICRNQEEEEEEEDSKRIGGLPVEFSKRREYDGGSGDFRDGKASASTYAEAASGGFGVDARAGTGRASLGGVEIPPTPPRGPPQGTGKEGLLRPRRAVVV